MLNRPIASSPQRRQLGVTLIEVLVAVLILSFGMLSLGAMQAFAVQLQKQSGYRAVATNLASNHIERIRANPLGFQSNSYVSPLNYDGTFNSIALNPCAYPACTSATLATMDIAATQQAARTLLPAGGMLLTCDTNPCGGGSYGNLWIIWQVPATDTSPTLGLAASDDCPATVVSTFTDPKPRCLYVRFRID